MWIGITVWSGESMTQATWVLIVDRTSNSGKKKRSWSKKLLEGWDETDLNLVPKLAKGFQGGFSDASIETPENLVPRTSARRVNPLVKKQSGKARCQGWRQRPWWVQSYQFSSCSLKTSETSCLKSVRGRSRLEASQVGVVHRSTVKGLGTYRAGGGLRQDWK